MTEKYKLSFAQRHLQSFQKLKDMVSKTIKSNHYTVLLHSHTWEFDFKKPGWKWKNGKDRIKMQETTREEEREQPEGETIVEKGEGKRETANNPLLPIPTVINLTVTLLSLS